MTPDDGQKTCPKHVEFYSKNKFDKLVHLIGFIIRIPSERLSMSIDHLVFRSPTKSSQTRIFIVKRQSPLRISAQFTLCAVMYRSKLHQLCVSMDCRNLSVGNFTSCIQPEGGWISAGTCSCLLLTLYTERN